MYLGKYILNGKYICLSNNYFLFMGGTTRDTMATYRIVQRDSVSLPCMWYNQDSSVLKQPHSSFISDSPDFQKSAPGHDPCNTNHEQKQQLSQRKAW